MSVADLYRKNKFSLAGELKPDRFRRKHYLPDQHVEIWSMYLQELRRCCEDREATEVDTDFIDYFNPADKPKRWPDLLTK